MFLSVGRPPPAVRESPARPSPTGLISFSNRGQKVARKSVQCEKRETRRREKRRKKERKRILPVFTGERPLSFTVLGVVPDGNWYKCYSRRGECAISSRAILVDSLFRSCVALVLRAFRDQRRIAEKPKTLREKRNCPLKIEGGVGSRLVFAEDETFLLPSTKNGQGGKTHAARLFRKSFTRRGNFVRGEASKRAITSGKGEDSVVPPPNDTVSRRFRR